MRRGRGMGFLLAVAIPVAAFLYVSHGKSFDPSRWLHGQLSDATFIPRLLLFAAIAAVAIVTAMTRNAALKLSLYLCVTGATIALLIGLGRHVPQEGLLPYGLIGLVGGGILGGLLFGSRIIHKFDIKQSDASTGADNPEDRTNP